MTTEDRLLTAIRTKPEATLRELADMAGLSGVGHADYHLKALVRKGVIRKVNKWEVLTE